MLITRIVVPAPKKVYKEPLSVKLRRNWLAKQSVNTAEMESDDSLTSLDWLLDLNMTKVMSGVRRSPQSPQYSASTQVNPNAILDLGTENVVITTPIAPRPYIETVPSQSAVPDYRTDPRKPPYSYAKLIACAIKNSENQKSTLSGIYNWITENFMYYRISDNTWHNSIRHNLSLNKSFVKVPRRKDEPGKGGFWAINPEFPDQNTGDVLFRKRNWSPDPSELIQTPKRIKIEKEDSLGYCDPQHMFNAMTETRDAVNSIEFSDESSSYDTYTKTDDCSSYETIGSNWHAILHQDIEVGGVKVKTEHLLDETDDAARAITSYSPPPSENSSSEILFNDLLKEFDPSMDSPLANADVPLDMTLPRVNKLDMHNWWDVNPDSISTQTDSRLSTPNHSSSEEEHSQWSEESEQVPGYFDNIFDLTASFSSHAVSVL